MDGFVDFRNLGAEAVRIEGKSVTITLPRARLGEAAIDLAQSRVVARDRGVVGRVSVALRESPASGREVAALAQCRMTEATAASDLLRRTEDNTRAMLTALTRSLGYNDVTVRFDVDTHRLTIRSLYSPILLTRSATGCHAPGWCPGA